MASLSFRDRFFSPPVARALTSPSGILALGAGVAVGVVATAPVSVPLAVAGALVGGIVGLGARVALALPKKGKGAKIDPFAVNEPWRHAVKDAVQARTRFGQAVKAFRSGPLHDTMSTIGARVEEAVEECWQIAQQGQVVANARKRINDRETNWELQQARHAVKGGQPNETQARTIAALEAQLATAQRMDDLVAHARDQLGLLNARLDESVTRAIELSVTNQASDATVLGNDVGAIVDELESLRMAINDVNTPIPAAAGDRLPPPPDDEPEPAATEAPGLPPAQTLPPPPLPATSPPPLPRSEPGGQTRGAPGS